MTTAADRCRAWSPACAGWTGTARSSSRCGSPGCSAYGFLAVVLVLYLAAAGLDPLAVGLVLTLTLIGDTIISLWLTTHADRFGRRRVLVAGAALMVLAGIVFASTSWLPLLILAGAIGVISPTGNEVGPFLAVEQAALSQTVHDLRRTATFAWYNLVGYVATATGALGAGLVSQALLDGGTGPARCLPGDRRRVRGHRGRHGRRVLGREPGRRGPAGRDRRRRHPATPRPAQVEAGRASAVGPVLASTPSAAGSSRRASWRTGSTSSSASSRLVLGAIFFGANLLAAVSSLSAARIAARFGLINTMVFTHLPSNVLLILVPLMPTLPLAILVLLLRYSLSQMDVPTRQSYVMAVVEPDERSAAAGVTGVARTTGAAHLAVALERDDGQRGLRGPAVLPRGRPQDPVRPAAVPRLPERASARGAEPQRS